MVLRGYDRLEVNARIEYIESQLLAAQDSLQEAETRNAELAAELRRAQDQQQQRSEPVAQQDSFVPQDSFGFRVEKILRLAEEEARSVRTQAAADATELVEQARAQTQAQRDEAEGLRAAAQQEADQLHESSQQEIEQLRVTTEQEIEQLRVAVRQEADQLRFTALREAQELRATVEQETEQLRRAAKQETDELRTTTEREADQLRSAAEQDAERVRADAESRAKALLASAERISTDQREHTERETQRLHELHNKLWADLARIRDILVSALAENPIPNGNATTGHASEAEAPDA